MTEKVYIDREAITKYIDREPENTLVIHKKLNNFF